MESCARCFGQIIVCYQKTPSSSKSTVAHSLLRPISSNRTVVHGLLDKFFTLLTKVAEFKKNERCAQCFDANFKQQDSCAQSFDANFEQQDCCARSFGNVFYPFNKSPRIQEKRQLRTVFWRQFRATGQLRTVFQASFSFFTKVAKFKQNDSCAEFHANRQLRRVFWRQFRATKQLRTVFFKCFSFLTKVTNLKQNDSCAECFDANFQQLNSWARCFGQFSDFNKSR